MMKDNNKYLNNQHERARNLKCADENIADHRRFNKQRHRRHVNKSHISMKIFIH